MAEADKSLNPLLAALPPATDYITYLTIIEYNLTKENADPNAEVPDNQFNSALESTLFEGKTQSKVLIS